MKHDDTTEETLNSLNKRAEALSDYELDKISGGYNENDFNKTDCTNHRTWDLNKCAFCTRLMIIRGTALCDGIMCNTVDYFCKDIPGHGFLMCTHYSLPTGETVKIKVYDNN